MQSYTKARERQNKKQIIMPPTTMEGGVKYSSWWKLKQEMK